MPKYLIELKHGDEHEACVRALHALSESGSHFVTHADWGCKDNYHSGWLVADVGSRDEAMRIVPPEFRHEARVVEVTHFTREQITAWLAELEE